MATTGNAPAAPAPAAAKPASERAAEDKKRKDEFIAKTAGAVIAGGIAWSLFKSVTGRGKAEQKTTDTQVKDAEHKAKDVANGAEHKTKDFMHTLEAAGSKMTHFGHKKLDGRTVQVHKGDTLWGIATKHNVSVEALMATNGIKNGDNIAAGESIVVPK